MLAAAHANAGSVTSVRMHRSPEYTRVVFDVSEHVTFSVSTLTNPDRVVVDIPKTELAPDAKLDPASPTISAPLMNLRHAVQNGSDLRWIFDLSARAKPKVFVLAPAGPYGHRLVVDLYAAPGVTGSIARVVAAPSRESAGSTGSGAPVSASVPSGRAPAAVPAAPTASVIAKAPDKALANAKESLTPAGRTTPVPTASTQTSVAPENGAARSSSAPTHEQVFENNPEKALEQASIDEQPVPSTAAPHEPSSQHVAGKAVPVVVPLKESAARSAPQSKASGAPATASDATLSNDVPMARAPAGPLPSAVLQPAPVPQPAAGPKLKFVPRSQEVVVAIDAGHGGEDPGAIGEDGVQEKDVVLAIAKRLAELVNAEPGFRAVLIRDGDYYIPLGLRPKKARDAGAHFFISVHADAHVNRTAHGASVYALSERGATSETAKWLAQRENSSDLVGGVSLDNKDKLLAEVLLDLSMTASLAESLEMGSHVLGNLRGVAKLHSRHVEQAGFRVLKSPDIPSILVETGYVSNASEAKQLTSDTYRREIASAIFAGVRAQALARPPRGTVFAMRLEQRPTVAVTARKTPSARATAILSSTDSGDSAPPQSDRRYQVAQGDTLAALAVRFGVSRRALRRVNGLLDDSVRSGQVLRIPEHADPVQ